MKEIIAFVSKELKCFTGLSDRELQDYISRKAYPHFKDEWNFWKPKTATNIQWYYISSRAYLFANSIHKLPESILNVIKSTDTVLDFGGGSGNYSFQLAMKGCRVQYFDVNILQQEFVKFVSKRHNFNIEVLDHNNYLPIFTRNLNSILALDVLEHIPNYDQYIELFGKFTDVGSKLYIHAPFGNGTGGADPSHLKDTKGMVNVLINNKFKHIKNVIIHNGAHYSIFEKGN